MESISNLMKFQRELIQKRKNLNVQHKQHKPKKVNQLSMKLTSGTTNIPNAILEAIIADTELTKRELKILLLIVRLTIGLHNNTCEVTNRQMQAAGIGENHTQETITSLIQKGWLVKLQHRLANPTTRFYKIHPTKFINITRDKNLSLLIATALYEKRNKK